MEKHKITPWLVLEAFPFTTVLSYQFSNKLNTYSHLQLVVLSTKVEWIKLLQNISFKFYPFADFTSKAHLIDGLVGNISHLGSSLYKGEIMQKYELHIYPPLYLLQFEYTSRIFMEVSVINAVEEVCKSHQIPLSIKCAAGKQKRDYITQFNEDSLTFITRLLNHEGIFFYYADNKLVLVDDINHCTTKGKYITTDKIMNYPRDMVITFRRAEKLITQKFRVEDSNYLKPRAALYAESTAKTKSYGTKYIYPGRFNDKNEADAAAKLWQDSQETSQKTIHLTTTILDLEVADIFSFEADKLFILEVEQYGFTEQALEDAKVIVSSPLSQPLAPHYSLITAQVNGYKQQNYPIKPLVTSVQSAIVVGQEPIYAKDILRVKVQFPWDQNHKNTIWLRVMQLWSGDGFGAFFVPRVGHEVAVGFLNGDIDSPVIVGMFYNKLDMPAFESFSQSGIRTRTLDNSHKYNEFSFEDKAEHELLYLRAQKDYTTEIMDGSYSLTLHAKEEARGNAAILLKRGDTSLKLSEGDLAIELSKGDISIELTAGNTTVTLSKGDLTIETQGKINIEASSDISIKSATAINMQAPQINLEGSQISLKATSMSLEATTMGLTAATLSLKAALSLSVVSDLSLSINGGIVNIQSNMVMSITSSMTMSLVGSLGLSLKGLILGAGY